MVYNFASPYINFCAHNHTAEAGTLDGCSPSCVQEDMHPLCAMAEHFRRACGGGRQRSGQLRVRAVAAQRRCCCGSRRALRLESGQAHALGALGAALQLHTRIYGPQISTAANTYYRRACMLGALKSSMA